MRRGGRDGRGGRGGYDALRVASAVVYERVAEVEARDDSARRVELQDAAEVCGEVRATPVFEDREEESLAAERERLCAGLVQHAAERDEAGACLREDAEAPVALADFRAELELHGEAARRAVRAAAARVIVAFGFEREVVREVVADARAESGLGVIARVEGREGGEAEVFRGEVQDEGRELNPDLEAVPRDRRSRSLRAVVRAGI